MFNDGGDCFYQGGEHVYNYITVNTEMPTFMQFPKFLLDMEINETAKLLYMVLLDRARLSMVNKGWQDEYGRVYMVYPIEDLAARLHKCPMTVKTALATLQRAGLIMRKRQGIGRANLIYVKLPEAIQAGYTGNTVETDCRQQTVHVSSDNFPARVTESAVAAGSAPFRTSHPPRKSRQNHWSGTSKTHWGGCNGETNRDHGRDRASLRLSPLC